jgi:hypothetical protein
VTARHEHLPIYKEAYNLALYFEKAVRGFSRYDKYTLGADLRNLSREILRLIQRASSEEDRIATLREVRVKVEELKTVLRLVRESGGMARANSYEFASGKAIAILSPRFLPGWQARNVSHPFVSGWSVSNRESSPSAIT